MDAVCRDEQIRLDQYFLPASIDPRADASCRHRVAHDVLSGHDVDAQLSAAFCQDVHQPIAMKAEHWELVTEACRRLREHTARGITVAGARHEVTGSLLVWIISDC